MFPVEQRTAEKIGRGFPLSDAELFLSASLSGNPRPKNIHRSGCHPDMALILIQHPA